MSGFLRRWRITWRGYSFGPGRYTWPEHHGRHASNVQADRYPVADGLPVIREKLGWRSFVQAHEWPGSCPDCVWWDEDGGAVYQPCPRHDPAYGPEQEKKAGQ